MWVVVGLIPILYESTLSDATFQTNGICRLTDTLNCTVTEERNGEYSLELEYPFSGVHADEITVNRIIKAKANDTSDLQCFRIFSVTPTLDGKRIKVEANHISYDLCFFPVSPFNGVFNSVATSITGILNNSVNPSGFYNSADYEPASAVPFKVIFPKSIRSCLGGSEGSVLDNFGGEYEWDNRLIKWHKARGKDNGVTIRYGKNLTDYKQETNIEQTVCGILPYYNMDGVVVYGSIQYSDNYESFPFRKVATKDFTDKFADGGEAPTAAELETLAASYIANNGIGQPEVCIEVEFYPVGQTEGYEEFKILEQVSLCDIVTVIFPDLNVRTKAKVVKTVYNSLLEKYNKIELGTIRRTLADTIADMEGGGSGSSIDSIVAEGTDGNWTYRKWSSGISECWGYYDVSNVACTTASGQLFVTGAISPNMAFPAGVFADDSTLNVQMCFHSYQGTPAFVWVAASASPSVGATPFRLMRPTSTTISGRMEYSYKGRWK